MNKEQHIRDRQWFKACLENHDLITRLKKIKLVISDIDGALTDARIFITADGQEIKGWSVQDGFQTVQAIKNGLAISFMTGKKSPMIEFRARTLGIPERLVVQGLADGKIGALKKLMAQEGLAQEEVLFYGDDTMDGETKGHVGLFATPSNAMFYIYNLADLKLPKAGHEGAFRLLLDLILFVQDKHNAQEFIKQALLE